MKSEGKRKGLEERQESGGNDGRTVEKVRQVESGGRAKAGWEKGKR